MGMTFTYANEPSYIQYKVYTEACDKFFDFGDKETRDSLRNINEDDQSRVLMSLTTRLYDQIMNKVDDIDYGEIPRTKGDITKLSNYQGMKECIDILTDLFREYKQPLEPVDTIRSAINNLEKRTDTFRKGFMTHAEFVIFTYDSAALACIQSLSLMISTCIEFIKSPTDECIDLVLNNVAVAKTYRHLLFEDLKKFNAVCASGDMDKILEFMMSKNGKENFLGGVGVAAGVILGLGLVINLIPLLRELIYFYYHIRVRMSDYLSVQADLLQLNAYNLEHGRVGKSVEERKKIAKKQQAIVDGLRKTANAIAIDCATAEKKATVDIVKDSKTKYKASDVLDSMPDSATRPDDTSSGSLF